MVTKRASGIIETLRIQGLQITSVSSAETHDRVKNARPSGKCDVTLFLLGGLETTA